ncbi:MAG: DUF5056 domain-containing protein [Prevotella sp.]|nr:DUF5056 domain-containing protein [Prevotella sp.]
MTEKENKLIEDLFKQAAQQQIEDNGFTERVMEAIGNGQLKMDNGQLLSVLWTWFCIAVSLVLFFVFNGWEMLKASLMVLYAAVRTSLEVFVTTAPTTELDLTPWMILLALGFVSIYLPYQTARKLSATL